MDAAQVASREVCTLISRTIDIGTSGQGAGYRGRNCPERDRCAARLDVARNVRAAGGGAVPPVLASRWSAAVTFLECNAVQDGGPWSDVKDAVIVGVKILTAGAAARCARLEGVGAGVIRDKHESHAVG